MSRFNSIVDLLRFFVEKRQYSIVDRFANALSPDVIEVALYEALRTVKSASETEEVKILIPDEESIKYFLNIVRRDISIAREIAIRALSKSSSSIES